MLSREWQLLFLLAFQCLNSRSFVAEVPWTFSELLKCPTQAQQSSNWTLAVTGVNFGFQRMTAHWRPLRRRSWQFFMLVLAERFYIIVPASTLTLKLCIGLPSIHFWADFIETCPLGFSSKYLPWALQVLIAAALPKGLSFEVLQPGVRAGCCGDAQKSCSCVRQRRLFAP